MLGRLDEFDVTLAAGFIAELSLRADWRSDDNLFAALELEALTIDD